MAERNKTKYPGVFFRHEQGQEEKVFYIRYRRGGRGGKLIEEPIGSTLEGMTAAKANWIRGQRMQGKELSNAESRATIAREKQEEARQTIGSLWQKYYDSLPENKSRKTHLAFYKFLAPFTDREPATLTTLEVAAFGKKLAATPSKRTPGKKLSAQTVKHVLGLLRSILRYAAKVDLCPYPQGLVFTMPKVDNQKTETMTNDQLAAYIAALDAEPDQHAAAFLRVCLFTGLRKGAVMGLQWADLDFERRVITLRGEHAKNGKTDYVPMPEPLADIFAHLPRTDSPFIFPGKDGGKREDFRRVARRVRTKAGLPKDFRPVHSLRHVYASRLVSNNVPLYTIQKLLTHSSPTMTQRYSHLADEALQQAADLAGNIFSANIKKD